MILLGWRKRYGSNGVTLIGWYQATETHPTFTIGLHKDFEETTFQSFGLWMEG